MIFAFKKRAIVKKEAVYPAFYKEWVTELDTSSTFIGKEKSKMLEGGSLEDAKYYLADFKSRLAEFIEAQIGKFFAKLSALVQQYTDEANGEYLLLTIRRYNTMYRNLFFFRNLVFLDAKYRDDLASQLEEKIDSFNSELLKYFEKAESYGCSMCGLSMNLKRIMREGKR
ncbi:MAG: hypothetical protein IKC87_03815 [Clostridia bacterium]|nr:hypothetical protein [Clostridia bacterium]